MLQPCSTAAPLPCLSEGGTASSALYPHIRHLIRRDGHLEVLTPCGGRGELTARGTSRQGRGVIENNYSTDGQIAINRQTDIRELRVNAHTMVCGWSAITNRIRAFIWAFTHSFANVDLAVEKLFSITPVQGQL